MYEDKMKNQNYKLKDLIRIWLKACFKRAMQESSPASSTVSPENKKRGAK